MICRREARGLIVHVLTHACVGPHWPFPALASAGTQIPRTAQHALPRDRPLRQSDRPRSPDDGKRGLPQLRALDPMPVLGGAGGVSSILNGIMKLASATSTTNICSRSVPRAAEPDLRGHKRAVDAHHLLCLTVAMWVRAAGRLRHRRHAHRRGRGDALPVGWPESRKRCCLSPRAREAAPGQAQV